MRDELNVNLDRLTLLEVKGKDLKNQALGVVAAKKARPVDDVSSSVALAYKLLERLENP